MDNFTIFRGQPYVWGAYSQILSFL